jgi:alpha-1,3-rhamnosyl/mannosyltransferase
VVRALEDVAGDTVELTFFVNRRFPAAHPELASGFATAVAPVDGRSRPLRIAAESTWLAREANRRDVHLVHHLNNVVPWIRSGASVLTIHDLRPITMPDSLGSAHGAYLRSRFPPSVRHAAVITTPSEFVRGTVIDLLDADPERVLVVSAPVVLSGSMDEAPADVDGPSFIYPAITNPHKNHVTLLEAFGRVAAAHPEVRLVLTGGRGSAEEDLATTIARLSLSDRVDRMGRVPVARLDALFRAAVALVYPSRYEGFGLPLTEAMAVGCPVIASNATALPEVAGSAGVLVDPDDVGGWVDSMLRVLEDDAFRSTLIEAGRERVRAFTPHETARRQVDAYRLALGSEPADRSSAEHVDPG